MSTGERPSRAAVLNAIESYLRSAYGDAVPPQVAARVETVRQWPAEDFYGCPAFERAPEDARRYALRLGNPAYPPMKLVIERMPTREQWFFRADTHDAHIRPEPTDPEHEAFCALMTRNRALAAAIEGHWAGEGLPTFQAFLREDLERRARSTDRR
jgi:hypothetical protein